LPGALDNAHPVGEVVGHAERDVGHVRALMTPSPRGTQGEEDERAPSKPWMKGCQEKRTAKRSNDAAR